MLHTKARGTIFIYYARRRILTRDCGLWQHETAAFLLLLGFFLPDNQEILKSRVPWKLGNPVRAALQGSGYHSTENLFRNNCSNGASVPWRKVFKFSGFRYRLNLWFCRAGSGVWVSRFKCFLKCSVSIRRGISCQKPCKAYVANC